MYSRLEENEKIEIEANVISSKESKKYYNKYVIETVYKKQKIKLYIKTNSIKYHNYKGI